MGTVLHRCSSKHAPREERRKAARVRDAGGKKPWLWFGEFCGKFEVLCASCPLLILLLVTVLSLHKEADHITSLVLVILLHLLPFVPRYSGLIPSLHLQQPLCTFSD